MNIKVLIRDHLPLKFVDINRSSNKIIVAYLSIVNNLKNSTIYLHLTGGNMRKLFLFGALFLCVLLSATILLAGGKREEITAEKQVTINYITSEPQEVETFERIIAIFEERNPNINVEIEGIPFGEYYTVIKTRLAGGDVDVFVAGPGGVMTDVVEGGYAADITGQPLLNNLYIDDMIRQVITFDGKIRGFVLNKYIYIVVYNRDLFDRYGVEEPKSVMVSFEELKEIAEAFNRKGLPPMACGLSEAWASGMLGQTITTQVTYPDNIWIQIETGAEKLTGSRYRRVAKAMVDFSDAGILDPNAAGTTYDGSISLFQQGKVPMVAAGNWTFVSFQQMNVGSFVPIAPGVKTPVYQSMPGNIFCVNPKSPKPNFDAGLKFLEFITTKEAGQIFQDGTFQNTTVKGVQVDNPLLKSVDDLLRSDYPTTLGLASSVQNLEIAGILDEVDTLLLRPGEKDMNAILAEKQEMIDDILGK